jgi:hypothetical protein
MKPDPAAQCRTNLAALFAHLNVPAPPVIASCADRCFYVYRRAFEDALKAAGWLPWNTRIMEHKVPGATADHGWREDAPWCAGQVVIHRSKVAEHALAIIEADIDLGNPAEGALPAIVHAVECLLHRLHHGRTDPFRVARWLRRRHIEVPSCDSSLSTAATA